MAHDSRLHLQVADGHLRLVPQGDLTEGKIRQILRAAEVGLQVFSLVVVDLRASGKSTARALTLLEEGLQQIIVKRKHVLLNPKGTGRANHTASRTKAPVIPGQGEALANRPKSPENPAAPPIRIIVSPSDLSRQG